MERTVFKFTAGVNMFHYLLLILLLKISQLWASNEITSWQIKGKKVETIDFIFLEPQITADMKLKDTCYLEEKL